jgi:GNAT superfamily N-acetyltransferase
VRSTENHLTPFTSRRIRLTEKLILPLPLRYNPQMSMKITLKETKGIDITLLKELYQYAPWAKDRPLNDIKTALLNSTLVVSAWDRDLLVGFARVLSDKVFRATLWDVIVHPDYQKEGIGSMLIEKIISHPILKKVDRFWLNTKHPHFYEKFGFIQSHEGMLLERKRQ